MEIIFNLVDGDLSVPYNAACTCNEIREKPFFIGVVLVNGSAQTSRKDPCAATQA